MLERRGTIVGTLGSVETKKSELGGSIKRIFKSVKKLMAVSVRPLVVCRTHMRLSRCDLPKSMKYSHGSPQLGKDQGDHS